MTAKGWDGQVETKIIRIYEDFGLGLTDRFALRGALGYTHDADIDRSGFHNARLGLVYRGIKSPVVWDIWADAWLGGISEMKAELIKSETKDSKIFAEQPISFQYENYANGRWGMWLGTSVGKSFGQLALSVFGEFQKTFGNDNNEIKINDNAKPIISAMVKNGVINEACALAPALTGGQISADVCKANPGSTIFPNIPGVVPDDYIGKSVDQVATGATQAYVGGLPEDFNADTKSTVDYAAGIKALYDIDNNWAIGGGFAWRHRAPNSIEALNITNSSKLPEDQKAKITNGIADNFIGSMDDGIDEFYISLLGSRQITKNLQATLFGEYTFDSAEEKSQLGTDAKFEVGLKMNWQF